MGAKILQLPRNCKQCFEMDTASPGAIYPIFSLQPKPAGAAARTEMLLVGAQRDRRLVISAYRMIGIGEEVHIHAADPPGPEFDVARARPRVGDWSLLVPQARNQCCGHGARGALGEDAGLRRA